MFTHGSLQSLEVRSYSYSGIQDEWQAAVAPQVRDGYFWAVYNVALWLNAASPGQPADIGICERDPGRLDYNSRVTAIRTMNEAGFIRCTPGCGSWHAGAGAQFSGRAYELESDDNRQSSPMYSLDSMCAGGNVIIVPSRWMLVAFTSGAGTGALSHWKMRVVYMEIPNGDSIPLL